MVQILLEKGADVNAEGRECGTALQAASEGGHEKVVQILCEKGADVNAQGGFYSNALQAASGWGHEKVVQMLEFYWTKGPKRPEMEKTDSSTSVSRYLSICAWECDLVAPTVNYDAADSSDILHI